MEDYYTEDVFSASCGDNDFDICLNDIEREIVSADSHYSRQFSIDGIDKMIGL